MFNFKKLKENEKPEIIVFLLFFIIAIIIGQISMHRFRNESIVTVARVNKSTLDAGGSYTELTVFINGMEYRNVINDYCLSCIGKYYFVKIRKDKPEKLLWLYKDRLVPECILKSPIPGGGWKDFPTCK